MDRNVRLDQLKLVLSILIVILHFNPFIEYPLFNNWLLRLTRIAVPCFFIINGFYIEGILGDQVRFRKYIIRLLKLFIVWQIIYLPYSIYTQLYQAFELKNFLTSCLFGYDVIWYLGALAIGATILHGIALLNKDRKIPRYMTWVLFFVFLIGCYIQLSPSSPVVQYLSSLTSPYAPYRNFLFIGLPFVYLGYFMKVNGKINLNIVQTVVLIMVLWTIEIWYLQSLGFSGRSEIYISFFITMPLFMNQFFFQSHSKSKYNFTQLPNAIYYSHMLFVTVSFYIINQLNLPVNVKPLIGVLLIALILISSYGLTVWNKRVKILL